ncbi:T9SS type B sorting domain-containing protein [Flavobacterium sp. LB1P71]|uniref:T9SS type B sorting domain-containing protein n=1 Tax=unclassified Flavobacterium TaxID=196869 RepID=UPI003AAD44AC
MEKFIKSFVFIFLIANSFNSNIYAKKRSSCHQRSSVGIDDRNALKNGILIHSIPNIVASPPSVTTPIYYCQNSVAVPLTATPSVGGTLIWYGTVASGGVGSATAPTPSTTTVGQTKYYVSQDDGTGESTRAEIIVNIVADNGAAILNFRCDPTQATTTASVFFDWSNNPLISNTYNYSYSINGGATVTGTTGVSHQEVFGVSPGESATLTLTSATHPCVPSKTITCTVPCGASTATPNFPAIASFCSGTVAPILTAASPNGIIGTWSPAIINNTTSGSYVFTPNPILFPCATTQTLAVTVTPLATPTFTTIPTTVCQNATAPTLPTSSTNSPAITGTWSPATVNTTVSGSVTYTFTPNTGQCVSATLTTVSINIVPIVAPNFANIPPFCSGTTAPLLSSTSPNGIVGTWSPSIISNTTSRNYLFTPNANQCATTQTLSVVVTPKTTPNFAAIPAFCTGTTAPILASTSPNGINGTWSPATINNTTSGSYVFTPNTTECATIQTLTVIINPLIQPSFADLSICSGTIAPLLPNTSPNGITGTWSPAIINNITSAAYVFTPNPNQCATSKSINVTVNQATLGSIDWTVTEAFSKNQIVTINAMAAGDYLYQLDDGPFQESPVFEYVSLGTHSITVKDKNGCGFPITRNNVLVIDYPKFFTPNNDGYNDTWNIFSLRDQTSSKILIFDRYGKLLKEIRPSGLGWDGTYIGQPMPANDYWFTVEYTEQDIPKKFKSHFSLKR